eukprot:scaffold183982_cov27-Tisochrysis_lutea.AAC.3
MREGARGGRPARAQWGRDAFMRASKHIKHSVNAYHLHKSVDLLLGHGRRSRGVHRLFHVPAGLRLAGRRVHDRRQEDGSGM